MTRTETMLLKALIFIAIVIPVICEEKAAVLILARGGSKGIRLKNLRNVGGISLLGRVITTAKLAGFKDITVSTDNALLALEALKFRINIFKRSYVTATDWAPSMWGVAEFIKNRPEIEILLLLQATSPFTQSVHLRSSLTKIKSPIPFDCIFSVTRSFKLRWNEINTAVYPVNFDYRSRPRRQDWNGELVETGAFYIARRKVILEGNLQNNKY